MTLRHAIVAVIVLVVVAAIIGCGSSPVAVVDGVKITESEFTDRLIQTSGTDILRDMIDRELLKGAADKAGLEVSDAELDKEIADAKKQFPSEEAFQDWLTGRDLTQEQWREFVRTNLLTRKLALKDVKYTDVELKAFFEQNKDAFARPATVSISEIVVATKNDADEVLAELKKPDSSFGDVARRYSLSPTRDQGGERPEMLLQNIPIDSIKQAAATLPVGQVSRPLDADGQWYIMQVRDRKAARAGSFTEDHKAIEEQYQLSHARPLQEILAEQIKQSNVKIVDPRFQELSQLYAPVPAEVPQFGAQGPQSGGAAPAAPQAPANAPAAAPATSGG